MSKKPVSLTLEEANLLWLKGRARVTAGGSLSEAVDQLIVEARAGRLGADAPSRSVMGTIDLGPDPTLSKADSAIRGLFAGALSRPIEVHETAADNSAVTSSRSPRRRTKKR